MKLLRLHRQARRMSEIEAQVDRMIALQASEWVDIMRRPGLLDRLMFARWLKKNERHATEYLAMEALDDALNGIDPRRERSVDALLAAGAHVVDIAPLESSGDTARRQMRRRWTAGVAAAAALTAVALIAWWMPALTPGVQNISTAVGEQRSLELSDGSTVSLNTDSQVRIHFTDRAREIELLAGEALFRVQRDPRRPFVVRTGGTAIRALGTQFNVYRKSAGTEVAVLEGKVEISAGAHTQPNHPRTLLDAGEGASIAADTSVTKRTQVEVARSVAWRQRRLMFRLDALADIAGEFNRYNNTPKIRLEDGVGHVRRFSGVFDADDPEAFAAMLGGDSQLRIRRENGLIVIGAR